MNATDETKIDKLINVFYAAFTTTGEKVGNLRSLFDQKGQVIKCSQATAERFTVSEFIDSRAEILKSGIYQHFKESEIDSKTMIDGRHAVRISQYQKVGEKDGKAFKIFGTKVFQLFKQDTSWKILFFTWMDKAAGRPIELRPLTEKDASLLYELMTADNWLAFIGDRGIKSVADAKQYIVDKMHPDLNVKGFINHVIIDSETKAEVGTCSLHNRIGVEGLDIGYAILESFEGKGYATTAAKKMVEMALNTYEVEKVSAITTDGNIGSCRILEKIGFHHHGDIKLAKSDEDLKLYVLRKKDWKGST